MSAIQNEDRRDGDEWPDEDVRLAEQLLEVRTEEDHFNCLFDQ